MDAVIGLLNDWKPPPVGAATKARLIAAALRAAGVHRPPPPPKAELHLRGRKHTTERDREAVRHHYDVGNEFFSLFLDESMTYSCAFFSRVPPGRGFRRQAPTLEQAQEAKLELVCTKLEPAARTAGARRRLRLGQLRHARRLAPRGRRGGDHPVREPGRARPKARRRGRPGGQGRDPRPGLPRAGWGELRRGRLDRDGRACRRGADRSLRRAARLDAAAGRAPPQPRHLAAPPRQASRAGRSRSATSSPTARRSTSRG